MLTQAWGAEVVADEARAATAEKIHELLLARENAIAAGRRANVLLENSIELQELCLAVGAACAYLSQRSSSSSFVDFGRAGYWMLLKII
jgi:hypothetical protein